MTARWPCKSFCVTQVFSLLFLSLIYTCVNLSNGLITLLFSLSSVLLIQERTSTTTWNYYFSLFCLNLWNRRFFIVIWGLKGSVSQLAHTKSVRLKRCKINDLVIMLAASASKMLPLSVETSVDASVIGAVGTGQESDTMLSTSSPNSYNNIVSHSLVHNHSARIARTGHHHHHHISRGGRKPAKSPDLIELSDADKQSPVSVSWLT